MQGNPDLEGEEDPVMLAARKLLDKMEEEETGVPQHKFNRVTNLRCLINYAGESILKAPTSATTGKEHPRRGEAAGEPDQLQWAR